MRATICPDEMLANTMPRVSGMSTLPASVAEVPSTFTMNSGRKTIAARKGRPAVNAAAQPRANSRLRNIDRSRSGSLTRRSIATKASTPVTATANRPLICQDAHGQPATFSPEPGGPIGGTSPWPRLSASSSDTMATMRTAAPARSIRGGVVRGRRSAGMRAIATPRAIAPTGRLIRNTQCQPNASVSAPPRNGPITLAMPNTAPNRPCHLLRSRGGNRSAVTAKALVNSEAPPMPWMTR